MVAIAWYWYKYEIGIEFDFVYMFVCNEFFRIIFIFWEKKRFEMEWNDIRCLCPFHSIGIRAVRTFRLLIGYDNGTRGKILVFDF